MVLCIILALLCLVISVFLFMGKGAWLIAGYNTMPEYEREQYDTGKMCRAVGVICAVCALLLGAMAYFIHRVEQGTLAENSLLPFTAVFVIVLAAAIVWAMIYINKYAKK